MSSKRKWLLGNSIALSIYLVASVPYYLTETTKLDDFVVLATLYLTLVAIHEVIIAFALLLQWLGYGFHKKFLVGLATFFFLLGGAFLFPSLVVLIPLGIINFIVKKS